MTDARCDECGFVYGDLAAGDVPTAIRSFGKRYRAPLTRFLPGEDGDWLLRQRPAPETWSALEYAAHVRDVFAWYDGWIRQCLTEDRPVLEGPGPDEAADLRRYNEDDPAAVADALAANAERLASTVEGVPPDGWERIGLRRDEERPVLFTARRAVHEGSHHLLDIGRGLRAVRERNKAAT
ncbi:MAG TPA: DinB family protein [Acidimicrobiales bacterium]|nr:DinB family protein [Acidimicrobiales bacterium]